MLLILSIIPDSPLYGINWALFSLLIISIIIPLIFWRFEQTTDNTKVIALVATMASLAAVSRVVFSALVSVQPVTFIVMISGYVFGPQIGFMVGAIAALVSNFFLGQGPWTPWQMFLWGMCGVLAGLLGRNQKTLKIIPFTLICGLCGYLFGWLMNIWHWMAYVFPLTWQTFTAVCLTSFAFDTMHAIGNVAFSLVFGKLFYDVLCRYRKYF